MAHPSDSHIGAGINISRNNRNNDGAQKQLPQLRADFWSGAPAADTSKHNISGEPARSYHISLRVTSKEASVHAASSSFAGISSKTSTLTASGDNLGFFMSRSQGISTASSCYGGELTSTPDDFDDEEMPLAPLRDLRMLTQQDGGAAQGHVGDGGYGHDDGNGDSSGNGNKEGEGEGEGDDDDETPLAPLRGLREIHNDSSQWTAQDLHVLAEGSDVEALESDGEAPLTSVGTIRNCQAFSTNATKGSQKPYHLHFGPIGDSRLRDSRSARVACSSIVEWLVW